MTAQRLVPVLLTAFLAALLTSPAFAQDPQVQKKLAGVKDRITLAHIEAEIAKLANMEREEVGVMRIPTSIPLSEVARAHSEAMRDRRFVGHESPIPGMRGPTDRYFAKFAKRPKGLGENVSKFDGIDLNVGSAVKIHNGFMGSPQHKANILRDDVQLMGVGCAHDRYGNVWTTQLFEALLDPNEGGETGADAPADGDAEEPDGGLKAAQPSGPTQPVSVFILQAGVGGVLAAPMRQGEYIRWGVTTAPETASASTYTPDAISPRVWSALPDIHNAFPEAVYRSGLYRLQVSPPAAAPRMVAVVGPYTGVSQYGKSLRAPVDLNPGDKHQGSLGDGLSPQVYNLQVPAQPSGSVSLAVADGVSTVKCAIYDDQGKRVIEADLAADGAPWQLALGELSPERAYTVVISDPEASPGRGDYSISLSADSQ